MQYLRISPHDVSSGFLNTRSIGRYLLITGGYGLSLKYFNLGFGA